jgi:hypothetical protein
MESKKLWQSKTFWTNILFAAVVPFLPENLKPSEDAIIYIFSAINLILRIVTKGKVELK